MKHARSDYDQIQDPSGRIPEDEPVFLLRAQDISAPWALEEWIRHAADSGANDNILALARRQLLAMNEWQDRFGNKVADL